MFSISFRKHRDEKKKNNLLTLIIKMQVLFARTIITSTACASSVSPSSYRNTILDQSARIFIGLFSKKSVNTSFAPYLDDIRCSWLISVSIMQLHFVLLLHAKFLSQKSVRPYYIVQLCVHFNQSSIC